MIRLCSDYYQGEYSEVVLTSTFNTHSRKEAGRDTMVMVPLEMGEKKLHPKIKIFRSVPIQTNFSTASSTLRLGRTAMFLSEDDDGAVEKKMEEEEEVTGRDRRLLR